MGFTVCMYACTYVHVHVHNYFYKAWFTIIMTLVCDVQAKLSGSQQKSLDWMYM